MHFFSEHSLRAYKEAHHDNQLILYKHTPPNEGSLRIITNETIKYTSPDEFNDPNDCSFHLKINFDNYTKQDAEEHLGENIPESDWPKFFPRFKSIYEPFFLEKMKSLKSSFGVSCFNNAPLETLMWSHYAGNHKGFMAEFKFNPSENDEDLDIPLVVEYSDKFPAIEIPATDPSKWVGMDIHAVVNKAFCSKSSNWKYEKEFRLIKGKYDASNISTQIEKFNPCMLNSIILGAKVEPDYEQEVRSLVHNFNERNSQNILIYKAIFLENSYELTIPNHPYLDREA